MAARASSNALNHMHQAITQAAVPAARSGVHDDPREGGPQQSAWKRTRCGRCAH